MTPDPGPFLLQVGDLAFLAGLVLMAVLSWAAARRILPGERVPMQWDLRGRPVWRLGRRAALMFSPLIAALTGLATTWQAHDIGPVATRGALELALVRTAMALGLVLAHALHLAVALQTLERERRRDGDPA